MNSAERIRFCTLLNLIMLKLLFKSMHGISMRFRYFVHDRIFQCGRNGSYCFSEDEQRRQHPILYALIFDHFTVSM